MANGGSVLGPNREDQGATSGFSTIPIGCDTASAKRFPCQRLRPVLEGVHVPISRSFSRKPAAKATALFGGSAVSQPVGFDTAVQLRLSARFAVSEPGHTMFDLRLCKHGLQRPGLARCHSAVKSGERQVSARAVLHVLAAEGRELVDTGRGREAPFPAIRRWPSPPSLRLLFIVTSWDLDQSSRLLIIEDWGASAYQVPDCLSWIAVVLPIANLLSEETQRRGETHTRTRFAKCSRSCLLCWRWLHRRAPALRGPV